MAGFFGGLVGGVIKGAEEAGKIGTGVVGGVVGGAGEVIEDVGEFAEGFGEALSGANKKKGKGGLKEKILHDLKYGEEEDIRDADADDNDDDYKALVGDGKFDLNEEDDENWDEAEQKLAKPERENKAVLENDDDGEEETLIPKHFSLKSKHNNKYLRYINEGENSDGLLRYSGDKVVSPYSKFEVRASKTEKGFVHIRCCYNNKFWVRVSDQSNYIAAVANEEEEDQSKWSCTLFEPVFEFEKNAYRFRHVQLDSILGIAESASAPYTNCLVAEVEDNDAHADGLSSFVDWDSMFILPKHVAFKGNNDKYLERSGVYLKFSADSVEDPSAAFEIVSTNDGYIRIKHVESGKYWIRSPNWIHCESINTEKDDPNTLFWPVKVDNNIVALRNMGNNYFCKRLTMEGKTNSLNAAVRTITDTARLEVTEIVVARSIENVEYRLNDARVYGKKVLTMSKGFAINKTEVADKISLKFRYEKKTEKTWNSSVSTTLGFAARFTSKVPSVGKTKVELSLDVSNENTWGETEKEKSFEEITESVTVPPMSKIKLGGIITQASCDVPFSYTRRDTLKSGKQVTRRFEDGLFTGVTTMDFKFETEKLPL